MLVKCKSVIVAGIGVCPPAPADGKELELSEAARRARWSKLFAPALALVLAWVLDALSNGLVVIAVVVGFVREGESPRFIIGVRLSAVVILASGDAFDGEEDGPAVVVVGGLDPDILCLERWEGMRMAVLARSWNKTIFFAPCTGQAGRARETDE